MKKKSIKDSYRLKRSHRSSKGSPVLILALILSLLSLIIIIWKGKTFLLGWRMHSLEYFIASLYLTFLAILPFSYLLVTRLRIFKNIRQEFFLREPIDEATRSKKRPVVSIVILFLLFSCALLAPVISPKDPNAQPDTLTLRYLSPFSYVSLIYKTDGTKIYLNEAKIEKDHLAYRRGDVWAAVSMDELIKEGENPKLSKEFFFLGTDKFGRDILSRIIYGSRVSLAVGILAVLIAASFGSLIGAVSGFFGKAVDGILMRMVDIILSFPRLFLILLIVALFKPSLMLTILVLGMTGWMGVSRLVRGQVLSLKETDFVQAATAMGQNSGQIIWKHLIPNTSALIIVDSTLRIGHIILVEAALSFLGLGVPPPTPTWGSIINDGRDALMDGWWISTFPGVAIAITVISFNLFGDFIRERMTRKESKL